MTPAAIETLLSNVSLVVTSAIDWLGDFVGTITASGNELLLVFAAVPLVGLGVGLLRRMLAIN